MRRALVALGVAVIALAMVWLYLIFPGMAKLPADYSALYHFEGTAQIAGATGALGAVNQTKMDRTLTTTKVNDADALIIQQVIKFTTSDGKPLSTVDPRFVALDSSESYAVDRVNRTNVDGGDKTRSGQFTFPANVKQEAYQMWSATTGTTLTATFVREETVQGLKVYVFQIDSKGNAYPNNPTTNLPQTVDIATTLKVEPVSGTPIDMTTKTTVFMKHPVAGPIPVLINDSHFTSATVDENVIEGKSNMNKIMWGSVYGFWGAIALGAVLIVVGLVVKSKAKTA